MKDDMHILVYSTPHIGDDFFNVMTYLYRVFYK